MTTFSPTPISLNNLYNKVIAEAENTSSELAAQLPEMVHDAELMLLRALDILNLHVYADFQFSSPGGGMSIGQTAYVAVPKDCEVVRYLMYFKPANQFPSQDNTTDQYSGEAVFLIRVEESFLQKFWPNKSITSQPKYYAILGSMQDQVTPPGQFLVAPTPDMNYALRIAYITRPNSLTTLDPDIGATYLSTWYPDLLFLAVMIRASAFMKSPQQLQMWESLFQASLRDAIKLEARKKGETYSDVSATTIPLEQRKQ